nr:MAG TPA: hypothetical protein [Caudoviricetes sp.]DAW93542.1 MAG TPA: hypothetical protein [Bacteriophage sp.]
MRCYCINSFYRYNISKCILIFRWEVDILISY